MTIIGIITEYNPFHNGHKYQIDIIREKYKDCIIIVLMSGSLVQRGDIPVIGKHDRAAVAIGCGVDVVFELPPFYSMSSAEFFASGGVKIFEALSGVDYLCFGSESGDINALNKCAENLLSDSFKVELKIHSEKDKNSAYPEHLYQTYCNMFGEESSKVLQGSNNILAVEYIKALITCKSKIKPLTIKRVGNQFNDKTGGEFFSSASGIRELMKSSFISDEFKKSMPEYSYNILADCIKKEKTAKIENIESAVLSHIMRMNPKELSGFTPKNSGFEYHILKYAKQSFSLEELYKKITVRHLTGSRLRRIILSAFFNITENLSTSAPSYVNLLAANKAGCEYLSSIRKSSELKIVTKPALYTPADGVAAEQLQVNLFTDYMYSLAMNDKKGEQNSLTCSPYIKK